MMNTKRRSKSIHDHRWKSYEDRTKNERESVQICGNPMIIKRESMKTNENLEESKEIQKKINEHQ